jgi:hypothetical protein
LWPDFWLIDATLIRGAVAPDKSSDLGLFDLLAPAIVMKEPVRESFY